MNTASLANCGGYKRKKQPSWATETSRKGAFFFLPKIDKRYETKGSIIKWFDPCSIPDKQPLDVEYSPTLNDSLTPSESLAVQAIALHIRKFAESSSCSVSKINIRVSEDDDHLREIICAIHLDTDANSAMSFWEDMDHSIEEWLKTQNSTTKELVVDQFITAVYWK